MRDIPYEFYTSLKYEEEICDLYAAAGEGYSCIKHARPVGQFWTKLKYGKWNPEGTLLIVTMSTQKYCVELRSMVRSHQMLIYLEDQLKFYGLLPSDIQEKTIIRLQKVFPADVWDSERRWLGRYPSAILDEGLIPISLVTSNARICVATYQGTFYAESLAANIPTVFFGMKSFVDQ
jgi:putative transferase (TIGR04331 family)